MTRRPDARWIFAGLLFLAFALTLQSQNSEKKAEPEQSIFGGEEVPGIPFIKRPVPIPPGILEILKQDETVKGCLSDNEPTPEKPFSSWFVASEVHLDGPAERDLVLVANPRIRYPDYMCFHSVEGVTWFWLFRQKGNEYHLILKAGGLGLSILKRRTNGLRDIRSGGEVGVYLTTITFRFDGTRYQVYQKKIEGGPPDESSGVPQSVRPR